jgi:hypothetical protein
MLKHILLIALAIISLSCSLIQRSNNSGYANNYSNQSDSALEYYNNKKDFQKSIAKTELAIPQTRPLSEPEVTRLKYRLRVKRLENRLSTNDEKKQYYYLKPHFKSDIERIMFLRLPTMTARKRWADSRGINTSTSKFSPSVSELIENNDISVGMTKKAVKESWGEPDFVEVAGNEIYGNERWNYIKVNSTTEGYKKENRVIYFESSRVAGWETKLN